MNIAYARIGLILLVASAALTGCGSLFRSSDTPATVYFVLDDLTPLPAINPTTPAPTLRVLDTTTSNFYDTEQLVFSRTTDTRGLYQFARWTERPSKRFAELMRTRLDQQGVWRVSMGGGYVRSDRLLNTELIEFYHDATSNPGQVRLVLRANLIDIRERKLVGQRVFEQQVPLANYDAAAAAQASSLAVSRVLDELTAWLATLK